MTSILITSSMTAGRLLIRCLKSSVAMAVLRFTGSLRKWRHAFFRPWQLCCSASVSMVATVPTPMYPHSFSSQINLSLSKLYLSAATSRCWDMMSSSSSSASSRSFPFPCPASSVLGNESVHKVEQSLEHLSLHVVYTDNARRVALLHCPKELCAEDW